MEQEVVRVCKQCGHDTRRSGLREVEGICISCWHDKATAADELLGEVDRLKRLYGANLAVAPRSIMRVIEAADRLREGDARVPRPISRSARVQR